MYQLSYVKIFSTNQDGNLVLSDVHGCVKRQITNAMCQIQQFDYDCSLVVTGDTATFRRKSSILWLVHACAQSPLDPMPPPALAS